MRDQVQRRVARVSLVSVGVLISLFCFLGPNGDLPQAISGPARVSTRPQTPALQTSSRLELQRLVKGKSSAVLRTERKAEFGLRQSSRRWVAKRRKARRRKAKRRRKYAADLPPRYRHRWDRHCSRLGVPDRTCYRTARSNQPHKIHLLAMKLLLRLKKLLDDTTPAELKSIQAKRDKYFHVSRWWWDRHRRELQFLAMDIVDRLIQPVLPQYNAGDYEALLTFAAGLLEHKALSRPREVALISRFSRWLTRRPHERIQKSLVKRFSKAIFQEKKCHWWYVVFITTFSPRTMAQIGPKISPAWCKYRKKYLRSKFRMPREIAEVLRGLHQSHPRITRLKSIGKSAEGRDVWALQVGKVRDASAPTTLLVGSQHGDEHMGGELLTHYATELLKRYDRKESQVRQWLKTRQVWFIPVVNPDGYRFDLLGGVIKWWRYNRGVQSNGEIGVDLNRNWDHEWKPFNFYRGGRIELPGSKAFSEPETKNVDRISWRIRKLTGILDVHQSGSVLLTPWAYTRTPLPGIYSRLFQRIGKYLTAVNRYRVYPARNLYPHQATLGDWGFGRHKVVSFVLELGRTVYVNAQQKLRIFRENKLLLDRFIELALDPFNAIRTVQNQPKPRAN